MTNLRFPRPSDLLPLLLILAAGLIASLVWWWSNQPEELQLVDLAIPDTSDCAEPGEVATQEPCPALTSPAGSAAPSASTTLTVDVRGKVADPGIVSVPKGSRVIDAIELAGGATGRFGSINLAEKVADGQQIWVGKIPEPSDSRTRVPEATAKDAPLSKVNINSATIVELQTLPGIGPVTADRILAWRADHGPFSQVADLESVTGVGPKTVADIADLILL